MSLQPQTTPAMTVLEWIDSLEGGSEEAAQKKANMRQVWLTHTPGSNSPEFEAIWIPYTRALGINMV